MKKTAERYNVSHNRDEIYHEHMQRYSFAKNFIRGKRVLDVACGSGYGSHFLASSGAQHVTGVDISPSAINYCKKRYRAVNLTFAIMDAVNLRFPPGAFNTIISFETFEHITDYDRFLSQLHQVIDPEGVLVMSTPNKAVYGKLGGDAHKFHVKEFYLDEFREAIKSHFEIQRLLGQRRSDHCDRKMAEHALAAGQTIKKNILLKADPFGIKRLIPPGIRYYLAQKVIGLSCPFVFTPEDLTISEDHIEESKFFICIATPL